MSFLRIFNRLSKKVNDHSGHLTGMEEMKRDEILLSPGVFQHLERMQLSASRFLPGFATGLRSSFRRKPSLEFREHRMYVPGDDVRYVDWNASGRQEHIFIKQGEHRKEASVTLLIDCSLSMAWGNPPKSQTVRQLAAILSYLTLNKSDKLFVIPFSDRLHRTLGPINGKGQVPGLLKYLRSLPIQGVVDYPKIINEVKRRLGKSGGLVFILSDFIDLETPQDLLHLFPAPKWDTILLHLLHPDEIAPRIDGDLEFFDIETEQMINFDVDLKATVIYRRRIKEWQEQLGLACIESNAFYALIPTTGIDHELVAQLRNLRLVHPI
jgi:hypothetical protein